MNSPRKLRIALYSPGTVGLGHMRRNLLIAQVLAESGLQSVNLLITEAREASAFVNAMPPGTDCLTLPGLSKGLDGVCRPRYLDLPLKEVIAMRARAIRAALKRFQPDLLIVDNLPRGAYRELDPVLKLLKATGRTRCVLGLRDVLDEPWSVHEAWFRWKNEQAIQEYYDAIWVYGDPAVYNMIEEYRFPASIASKIHFVGYLDQRRRRAFITPEGSDPFEQLSLPTGGLILCLVGGGQDGDRLAKAFSEAELPARSCGAIITGPFMPSEVYQQLARRAETHPRLHVLKFVSEPTTLIGRADRVVAMGGYNTVCEVLSFNKPALIVPRVGPRREQHIRAERFRQLGFIDTLNGTEVTAQALTDWLSRDRPSPQIDGRLDLHGLDRLPAMVEDLLVRPRETVLAQ
ncbi:MAG TPA: glycosyltransferase [Verrucomicrobiae bacterium]|nr:glycosyltransferase [Verrucomicrobiae bacterium]